MLTYKDFPAPLICDYMARKRSRALYAQGTEFQFGRIDMVATSPGHTWTRRIRDMLVAMSV